MRTERTPVLVAGGGLAGLSAAMFLAWHEVPVILVERHPGSSPHPRAIGYTPRTRELYRSVGLDPVLPEAPGRLGAGVRRVRVESLAGTWHEEMHWAPEPPAAEPAEPSVAYSPCGGIALPQDRLEPVLRRRAAELGADIRFGTEMLSFTQDGDGVRATLRGPGGEAYAVRAAYLVAADGHRSPVRAALGIGRGGRGHLHTSRSVLFRAPLEEYLESGYAQFVIDRPGLRGMITTYGDGRWALFLTGDDTDRGEEELRELLRRAIGRRDVPIEIITTGRWVVGAWVADRYADGRVFLAGDAAHTLPPNRAGFSANTGIEDAHNLAWKLAAVLAGTSAPELLATYEEERRPVAWLCHDQIFAHDDGHDPGAARPGTPVIDDLAMVFGPLYRSGAVLGAGADLPPALRPDQWAGQPGTRAPHVRLPGGGSTLDLFGRGWVLLADGPGWAEAAREAGLECHRAATGDVREAYGLDGGGAALVRPDGYIAWRSHGDPAGLRDALDTVAYRSVTRHQEMTA